jgi:CRP/FNR family transcriptional regulator, cyclic AMP receptor protein
MGLNHPKTLSIHLPLLNMPATPSSSQPHWQLLVQGNWFSQISPALQQGLLDSSVTHKLADGERLFSRGDPFCGLYAVLDGFIRISGVGGDSDNAKEAVLILIEPPNWFGEIALFDRSTRTHDASAEGAAVVLHVPERALSGLLAQHPEHWRDLGLLMAHKLRTIFQIFEDTALLPAPLLLARRLLLISEGYGIRHPDAPRRRVLQVSQEQLSRQLSISRQTINQILKGLEQKEIICLHRSAIEIIDFAKLRSEASFQPKNT